MTFGSLRLRLLIGAGVFICCALVAAAVGLALLFERHVESWVDGQLNAHMDQLIAGLELGEQSQIQVRRPPSDPRFERPLSGLYWEAAVEPSGPVLRSRSLWDFEIALPAEATVGDAVHHYRVAGPAGSSLYMVQRRIVLPQRLGRPTARVAVALDLREVRDAVWRFMRALVPFLAVLAALLTLATWAQVTIGLRPLATIRAKLAAIGTGKASRLAAGLPDEVQPLANEIDALLDARARQVESARARAADLAHGLKTPLQVLVGEADRLAAVGATESAGVIREVSAAMQAHVDREMTRARVASGDVRVTADVASVVASVVRVVQRTPDAARLSWSIDVPAGLQARIDPSDLAEAVGNLVENAARYAVGAVRISALEEQTKVTICVVDDGPGIPQENREEAMQRGTRLDTRGHGAGLGLAIVSEIAEAWNGGVSLGKGRDGLFCVRLQLTRGNENFTPT